tara:strand:- start:391 stop:669 length:279 start_codon:yes stop_codon:yes gene_type:complete
MKDLTMYNLSEPAYCEAKGLSKVWEAYANECPNEEIFQVGFNNHNGYVYIALENGITIGSAFGNKVEYIASNFHDGEEMFFDEFCDVVEYLD